MRAASAGSESGRAPNQERHLVFVANHGGRRCVAVDSAVAVHAVVVNLLTVVGKIDDHRVAPSEVTENARQHGIVVAGRVVIVGHDLSLHPVEIRAVVVFRTEVGLFRRKAAVVFHVLPPKMQ